MKNIILSFLFLLICINTIAQTTKSKTPAKKTIQITKEDSKIAIANLFDDEKYTQVITQSNTHLLTWKKDTGVKILQITAYFLTGKNQIAIQEIKAFYPKNDSIAEIITILPYAATSNEEIRKKIENITSKVALKLNPNSCLANYIAGLFMAQRGKIDSSILLLNTALVNANLRKDEIEISSFIAQLKYEEINQKEGELYFNQLLIKYNNDTSILQSFLASTIYKKEYALAFTKIDEYISKSMNKIEGYRKKILILRGLEKTNEACQTVEKIVALDSFYTYYFAQLKCKNYMANPKLKDTKKYTWEVESNYNYYNFEIVLNENNLKNIISYAWKMTNEEENNGITTLTKGDLDTAIIHKNYYYSYEKNDTLSGRTSIWLSQKSFKEILKDSNTNIDCGVDFDSYEDQFTVIRNNKQSADPDAFEAAVKINGVNKFLDCIHISNTDDTKQIWILNNAENPIIVKMDMGKFKLTLKSID